MDFLLIAAVSFGASCLSLFSGFGLGTIVLPVFLFFLPADKAVVATAMVHMANNLLKVFLTGRLADFQIVLKFGLPAIVSAYLGASLLAHLTGLPPWFSYQFLGLKAQLSPLQFVLGLLILGFAMFELHPRLKVLSFKRKYLPMGGVLSGFFGGLSGHQGALRSAFLAKVNITAKAFVGTNATIGFLVDAIRLFTYGTTLSSLSLRTLPYSQEGKMIITGTLAAFLGVLMGMKFLHKVTMVTLQYITGTLLMLIGLLMTAGFI